MSDLTKKEKQEIYDAVQFYVDLANEYYDKRIPSPDVEFFSRGVSAGKANGSEVMFNSVIFKENWESMINTTVPHEVAHTVASWVFPQERGHGRCWKSVMAVFGVKPERCHNYSVKSVRSGRTFTYKCNCREVDFSQRRHNNVVLRGRWYTCSTCKTKLTLVK